MIRPTTRSTLFPYTTLFRSGAGRGIDRGLEAVGAVQVAEQTVRADGREGIFRVAKHLVQPAFEHLGGVVTVTVQLGRDRKSTRLNSSHGYISYAVFCLKKKK